MEKIKVISLLKNKTDHEDYPLETIGTLTDHTLQFYDENTKIILELMNPEVHMKRIQGLDTLHMIFSHSLTREGIYDIKSAGIALNLKTKTKKIIWEFQKIIIEYELELEGEEPKQFVYQLEYEVTKDEI